MQIQKVQSNQTTFGTKIMIDPQTARLISLTKAKNKVLRELSELEKNGTEDILSISFNYTDNSHVSVSVFEKNGDNLRMSYTKFEPLTRTAKNGRMQYISIKRLYKEARQSLHDVCISKKSFEKFLPYVCG